MIILIAVLLAIQVVLTLCVFGVLLRVAEHQKATWEETRDLRLTARTRVSRAAVQSGVAEPERELSRLGRASAARRVVFGGDGDSDLNRTLSQVKIPGGDEHE